MHKKGECYTNNFRGTRRLLLTTLHKDCGGLVLIANWWSWKTTSLKQDNTLGCCLCHAQPLTEKDTYKDYC